MDEKFMKDLCNLTGQDLMQDTPQVEAAAPYVSLKWAYTGLVDILVNLERIRLSIKHALEELAPAFEPEASDVFAQVQQDVAGRRKIGFRKYGKPLDPNDGRDWLKEAYEESLDNLIYLKAKMLEGKSRT